MKNLLILIVLTISLTSYGYNLPKELSKESRDIAEYILEKESSLELYEIAYYPESDELFIEYNIKIYSIKGGQIYSIYVLGTGDWRQVYNIYEANNSEYKCTAYISFILDDNGYEVIEVKADNGDVFYCYPQDHFYDNGICATVYYNDDFELLVGEDFIIYENSLDTWKYRKENYLSMWE